MENKWFFDGYCFYNVAMINCRAGGCMFGSILISLIVTVLAYLTVPVIFCLRGKKMTRKQIRKVSAINGCCVCFAFILLRAILEIKGSSGAVAVWMPVGYWIMSKKLLISDDDCQVDNLDNDTISTTIDRAKDEDKAVVDLPKTNDVSFSTNGTKTINFCRKCGNKLVPQAVFCHKCGAKINMF